MPTPDGRPPRTDASLGGVLVLLLVAPSLTACVSLDATCGPVHVPAPRGGTEIVWDHGGNGTTAMYPASNYLSPVAWGAVDPDEDGTGQALDPDPGSTLTATFARGTSPRIGLAGNRSPARQVTFTTESPERPAPLPFRDEWIDPDTGNHRQATGRANVHLGNATAHLIAFLYVGWPPVLGSSLFWGSDITSQTAGNLTLPDSLPWMPGGKRQDGWFDYEVAGFFTEDGTCHVRVRGEVMPGGPAIHTWGIETVYEDGVPVPVYHRTIFPDGASVDGTWLDIKTYTPGDGTPYPPFEAQDRSAIGTALDRAPPDDGFVPDRGGVFPTDYDAAVQAVRETTAGGAWLETHPDARPVFLRHRMGAPPGDVPETERLVDRWMIEWRGPDGDMMSARVDRVRDLAGRDRLDVDARPGEGDPDHGYPPERDRYVTMQALADLHERIYGSPIEIVECDLERGECDIGNHDDTDWPHARRGTSSWFSVVQGTNVWLERGWVRFGRSFSDEVLGPPAGA